MVNPLPLEWHMELEVLCSHDLSHAHAIYVTYFSPTSVRIILFSVDEIQWVLEGKRCNCVQEDGDNDRRCPTFHVFLSGLTTLKMWLKIIMICWSCLILPKKSAVVVMWKKSIPEISLRSNARIVSAFLHPVLSYFSALAQFNTSKKALTIYWVTFLKFDVYSFIYWNFLKYAQKIVLIEHISQCWSCLILPKKIVVVVKWTKKKVYDLMRALYPLSCILCFLISLLLHGFNKSKNTTILLFDP